MKQLNFRFLNSDFVNVDNRFQYPRFSFKKAFFIFFGFIFSLLFTAKVYFSSFNNKSLKVSSSIDKTENIEFKKIYLPPLLINFKNKKNLEINRVIVNLKIRNNFSEKKILSEKLKIKNHLLLVLSGKEIQEITKNKKKVEERILSQMNNFFSNSPIHQIRIQTEKIN